MFPPLFLISFKDDYLPFFGWFLAFYVVAFALLLGSLAIVNRLRGSDKAPLSVYSLYCGLRQHVRRKSWTYLVLVGTPLYPYLQYWLIRWQESQVPNADKAQAAAIAAAKVVDTLQVYSKFAVAIGSFCLINLLAWAAINMVMPVLADWAKGRYSEKEHSEPLGLEVPVFGFKRTYLNLTGAQRLTYFFVGMGLELMAAGVSVDAAFRIQ